MPFLHGFRRIIYEYQPLVDAVLCVVGLEEGTSTGERWVYIMWCCESGSGISNCYSNLHWHSSSTMSIDMAMCKLTWNLYCVFICIWPWSSYWIYRSRSPEDEDSLCGSLVELLEKESQSAVFEEGISYALFKVAERGLVCAAEVLLRYGADLNFEGERTDLSFKY